MAKYRFTVEVDAATEHAARALAQVALSDVYLHNHSRGRSTRVSSWQLEELPADAPAIVVADSTPALRVVPAPAPASTKDRFPEGRPSLLGCGVCGGPITTQGHCPACDVEPGVACTGCGAQSGDCACQGKARGAR